MTKRKTKRDLYATFEHIERYHRRRMIFALHAVVSLALQVAVWANWYGSYYVRDLGFTYTFFTDRITISIALLLFLLGHFVIMRLTESKDRTVVQALRRHEDELIDDELTDDDLDDFTPALLDATDDDRLIPFDDLDTLYHQENRRQRLER